MNVAAEHSINSIPVDQIGAAPAPGRDDTDHSTGMEDRARALFSQHESRLHKRIDRMFAILLVVQWVAAIIAALVISPRTWSGSVSSTHIHVWGALLVGGSITIYPVYRVWMH